MTGTIPGVVDAVGDKADKVPFLMKFAFLCGAGNESQQVNNFK